MNTLSYLLAGYVCFFVILSLYIFRIDRKTNELIHELEEIKKIRKN